MVRILASLHQFAYLYLGRFGAVAEGGLHPKHRLIRYHDFFVNNIAAGESVLEVGCGNGALLKDIVIKSKGRAVGVEISKESILAARSRFKGVGDVEIIHGDIFEYKDKQKFDVIVLSNTLEHLERRSVLLKILKEKFQPRKFLIRVPMFEREWVVPFKKELGLEWRLDPTHQTEYTQDEFNDELDKGGVTISKLEIRWGEFYVVGVPKNIHG